MKLQLKQNETKSENDQPQPDNISESPTIINETPPSQKPKSPNKIEETSAL